MEGIRSMHDLYAIYRTSFTDITARAFAECNSQYGSWLPRDRTAYLLYFGYRGR